MLVVHALNLNKAIKELWDTYQATFESLNLDDPDTNDHVLGVLAELEYNLIDVMDQVQGQIYLSTGVYEPLPIEIVEDFEASVLRDIAKLDEVDLEDYRVEYEDYEDE